MRAETFGQCIDAIRAMRRRLERRPGGRRSPTRHRRASCRAAELPLPALPDNPLAETVEHDFTFYFRSNSAMDTNSAVADVRADRATIWAGLKSPIIAQAADRRDARA